MREAVGYSELPAERALREPYLAAVRSQLGDAAWETAHEEGKATKSEQAVEYALSEEGLAAPAASATPEEPPVGTQPAALTRREQEVAELIGRKFTSRQIASELQLSERTVDKHVANLLKKLNIRSRKQVAVLMAQQRSQ
jgi:DNA-binding NarL/FixJ family response regulator